MLLAESCNSAYWHAEESLTNSWRLETRKDAAFPVSDHYLQIYTQEVTMSYPPHI